MGKQQSILEGFSSTRDGGPICVDGRGIPLSDHAAIGYAELALRLFARAIPLTVVAFAAPHRSEAVTRTVQGLAAEVSRAGKKVIVLNGNGRLAEVGRSNSLTSEKFFAPPSFPRDAGRLRLEYDCILLDCQALDCSLDILKLAGVADAVVMVIEAGRTTKQQVERFAQVTRDAGGTLLGGVFTQRQYPIPSWLYRIIV